MRGADASAGTIKSGGKCFREGTLVGTPTGMKPIEQFRIGDLVLTHEGPRAIADFMPNGEKQCYLVRTEEGYEVEVTAGHKFAYWDHGDGGFAVKPIEEFLPGDALYALLEPSTGGVTASLLPPQIADPPRATTTVEMSFPTELDDRWLGVRPRPLAGQAVHPRHQSRLVLPRDQAVSQASNRGVSMRTLRGLLRAHWGKITCLLLGVGLVVGGVSRRDQPDAEVCFFCLIDG